MLVFYKRTVVGRFVIVLLLLSFFPLSTEEGTFSRLDEIKKRGELKVSGNRNYEPFYIADPKDGYPGFDAELGKKYADFIGVKYTFANLPEFEDYAEAMKNGDIDIALAGLSSTLERSKRGRFSSPYLISTPGALVNKNAIPPPPEGNIISTVYFRSLKDLENISGLSFAVRAFSSSHEYIMRAFPNSRIFTYGSSDAAWDAVREGKANCFVGDSLYIKGHILKQPAILSNYRALIEPVQENHVSAFLPKGDIIFGRNFDFFLSEMKRTGELKALEDKYFNRSGWVK
ncbi:amino acid ABC transporter substrate-binding protein [Leptospira semungkisensis]|uniref:Amino acid ABC transporter substrate-binding protein n=1 Tax=Leptospira semungkisensis TaxID=2484985 RepID=A0A4V3JBE1_9LEPT|nr:transporter substrate-binding domain-containing protein [Leptospira semungkisensis]TGK01649.1 amino acid ABC transporter substrate-binding protein [Leptospira semungkisensis]